MTTAYTTPAQQVEQFRGTATDRARLIGRLVDIDYVGSGAHPDWANLVGNVAIAIALQNPDWTFGDVYEAADDMAIRGADGLTGGLVP
jgi:hypothetical protein